MLSKTAASGGVLSNWFGFALVCVVLLAVVGFSVFGVKSVPPVA